jgi:diguanylate cyclase (GGDEF)-like protein
LLRATNDLVRCRTVGALLEVASATVRDGLGYDRVALWLIDEARGALVQRIGTDEQGRTFYPRQRIWPLDAGSAQPRVLDDPRLRQDGPGFLHLAGSKGDGPPELIPGLDGAPGEVLCVAVRTSQTLCGLLAVDNLLTGRPLGAADAPVLVAFANALAATIENVAMLEERARRIDVLAADLQGKVEQLAWLQEAAGRLAIPQGLDGVLDAIYACVRAGLGYDRVGILLVEAGDDGRPFAREARGTDARGTMTPGLAESWTFDDPALPLHSPDLARFLEGADVYYCPDRWAITPPAYRYQLDGPMREQLAVAFRHEGILVGYLSVDNLLSERPITEADAQPLVAFAPQAALAISRARLWATHEEQGQGLARRVHDLEWLRDISRRVNVARTLEEVLDVVYDGIHDGLGYDRVGIQLFDHDAGIFEERLGTDAEGRKLKPQGRVLSLAKDSPIWHLPDIAALLEGAEYYYTADAVAETPPEQQYLLDGAPTEQLAVGLRSGDALIGMISVDNLVSGRRITPDDAGPLRALANQVGTAVENARLHERERAERARLEWMATTDGLTGLPNRLLLNDRVAQALRAAQRERTAAALLLMDLDGFKEVNDTLGHDVGDLLLREVGQRVRRVLRETDTVARLGGDEFAVLLPATDEAGAVHVANAILRALAPEFVLENQSLAVGASIGVAAYPDHSADASMLLRCADVAMYVAKREQSGYAVYATDQDQHSPQRLALGGALRQALSEGGLELYYQPLIAVSDQRLVRVEALARWTPAPYGVIPPTEFIALAERTGLIGLLTAWILEEALRQCQAWQVGVSVNLSVRTLFDPGFPDMVAQVLGRYAVPPEHLTLELTESALMTDSARAVEPLRRLNALGVRLAIDDFGTGYSSLGYLKRLPIDEIKIDKGFVRSMDVDTTDAAIVRAMIAMAQALGLVVVAKGVESAASWALLRDMRCDIAQGYYLSRPLDVAALRQGLRAFDPGTATLAMPRDV